MRLTNAARVELFFNKDDIETVFSMGRYYKYEQKRIRRVLAAASKLPVMHRLLTTLDEHFAKLVQLEEFWQERMETVTDERELDEIEKRVDEYRMVSYVRIDRDISNLTDLLGLQPKSKAVKAKVGSTRSKKKVTKRRKPHDAQFLQKVLKLVWSA